MGATETELKKRLIQKIQEIEDLDFLEAIQTILEAKVNEKYFPLSEDQKRSIALSREQIRSGQYKNTDEVLSELRDLGNHRRQPFSN